MKRRRLSLILLGCVATATLTILVWPREREPEYDGLPLSVWLKAAENFSADMASSVPHKDSPQTQYLAKLGFKSDSAVRHIGTNALPFLVRWIQYERPGWRKSLDWVSWRLPPVLLNSRARHWLLADEASDRADRAVRGFAFLGTNATPALPALQRLAKNASKPETQYRAKTAIDLVNSFDSEGNEIMNR